MTRGYGQLKASRTVIPFLGQVSEFSFLALYEVLDILKFIHHDVFFTAGESTFKYKCRYGYKKLAPPDIY